MLNRKTLLDDLITELEMLDHGANYFGIRPPKKNKTIVFDQDEKGNGEGPWIAIKLYKDLVKVVDGFALNQKEAEYRLLIDYFDHPGELAEAICILTKKYFNSFKCKWVRK